ncbi:hypothetical protein QLS71_016940 [Mariniflexile litorale]|uniref:SGNH/GDSL hydrolase family protein n=1 Tax=Mariniflexile litorale TaxID=3045158 RepID=A0AAU7EEY6_9FLAO|nr:hypothetical protein [Mariniflexile sp. KMM 9835]MDQ8211531.1 hypothetical protein [Mariniflexile sp. KMM 9835]
MKKLVLKILLYSVLLVISLEVLVRVFHLTKDYPVRYVDTYGVEKWMPNQSGFSVTGNRRQNFSEYHINTSGYNSYREFNPTQDKVELALVGDSFIEGFHQNYYNSIGAKIENQLKGIEVYEYGYAGYDLADQLHLIKQYKAQFDFIDYVFLGIKFENDLTRGEYHVVQDRMIFESPAYKALRQIKLVVYLQHIGFFDVPRAFAQNLFSEEQQSVSLIHPDKEKKRYNELETEYIANFESLVTNYGYDKNRFVLLLDASITPPTFLNYLDIHKFKFIDFGEAFKKSKTPTTLIYDKHWNNNARNIISKLISNYIIKHEQL